MGTHVKGIRYSELQEVLRAVYEFLTPMRSENISPTLINCENGVRQNLHFPGRSSN